MSFYFYLETKGAKEKIVDATMADLRKKKYGPYVLSENKDHPVHMVGRWFISALDSGWHHAYDFLKAEGDGYEVTLSGDKLADFIRAVERDLSEHAEGTESHMMFEMLRYFSEVAAKHGLAIRWGE